MLRTVLLCSLCLLTYSCQSKKAPPPPPPPSEEPGISEDPDQKQDMQHKDFGTKRSGPRQECSFR